MSSINIDPITWEEFSDAWAEAFDDVVEDMEGDFDDVSKQEIAELFFSNGFLQGCIAMTDESNTDLKETLYMLKQEIAYQTNH